MDADRFAILAKLYTKYWRQKKPYYGGYPLTASMQASLSIIQTRGFLTGKTYKTCADLNQAIISSISQYWTTSSSEKMDCALEVFDLIHAWGGRMGRNPYVLKKVEEKPSEKITSNGLPTIKTASTQLNAKIQNWRYPNFVKSHKLAYLLGVNISGSGVAFQS